MNNIGAFLSFKEQIIQGWFINEYSELTRDLEVLERYGRLTSEQHDELLKLASKVNLSGGQEAEPISLSVDVTINS